MQSLEYSEGLHFVSEVDFYDLYLTNDRIHLKTNNELLNLNLKIGMIVQVITNFSCLVEIDLASFLQVELLPRYLTHGLD